MVYFTVNGYSWRINKVSPDSPVLYDDSNVLHLAATDFDKKSVYVNKNLEGETLIRVLAHELGHCVIFSYGLGSYIQKLAGSDDPTDIEEFICNFLADYGLTIFDSVFEYLGDSYVDYVSQRIKRYIN